MVMLSFSWELVVPRTPVDDLLYLPVQHLCSLVEYDTCGGAAVIQGVGIFCVSSIFRTTSVV